VTSIPASFALYARHPPFLKKILLEDQIEPRFGLPSVDHSSFGLRRGIAGMLTIIKTSIVGSAVMLLASCTGYLTNYQTPCVEGHVCECVQYTTVYRSWLDCRDYGRVKSKAY
jgi:hypothetical protein